MATTSITNVSNQTIPIMVNSITAALNTSDVAATTQGQLTIAPGAALDIETSRIDLAQLDQLRSLKLLTYINS